MQEIKKLLEDIKQTGEGSLELKIENIVYERRFYRPERLIILGGGHVGQAISKFASAAGFYVIVVDDRPSFANRTYFPDAEEIVRNLKKRSIRFRLVAMIMSLL